MSAVPRLPEDTPVVVTNGDAQPSFKLSDHPIENLRPLKVIVIGAGYSGIYHSIRIPERLRNVELVVYEKNAGVGGTWYENRCADRRCSAANCTDPHLDIWAAHAMFPVCIHRPSLSNLPLT